MRASSPPGTARTRQPRSSAAGPAASARTADGRFARAGGGRRGLLLCERDVASRTRVARALAANEAKASQNRRRPPMTPAMTSQVRDRRTRPPRPLHRASAAHHRSTMKTTRRSSSIATSQRTSRQHATRPLNSPNNGREAQKTSTVAAPRSQRAASLRSRADGVEADLATARDDVSLLPNACASPPARATERVYSRSREADEQAEQEAGCARRVRAAC